LTIIRDKENEAWSTPINSSSTEVKINFSGIILHLRLFQQQVLHSGMVLRNRPMLVFKEKFSDQHFNHEAGDHGLPAVRDYAY
jgi:hypothetical protein